MQAPDLKVEDGRFELPCAVTFWPSRKENGCSNQQLGPNWDP